MIPFNRPTIAPNQLRYVSQAFDSGHLAGDGHFSRTASEILSGLHAGSRVLLTTSCTDALEMSALLLDLRPGDEVIVPSFTFVSTANAFVMLGARIVFADVDPDSCNVTVETVEPLVTNRTRAIVVVNYGGVPSVTSEVVDLCERNGLALIEDNAHGLFSHQMGSPTGTLSTMSTLSFHETKNITCGEGGALVLNDETLVERAEILREKGTNRSRFFRGAIDKYTWVDRGSSYLMSDISAAVLTAQLEFADEIQLRRGAAWSTYRNDLSGWASSSGFLMPHADFGGNGPFHLFPLLAPDLETRTRFLASARNLGVACTFHYLPLHSSPAGRRFGDAPLGASNSESISDRMIRVPLFSDITNTEVSRIVEVIGSFS